MLAKQGTSKRGARRAKADGHKNPSIGAEAVTRALEKCQAGIPPAQQKKIKVNTPERRAFVNAIQHLPLSDAAWAREVASSADAVRDVLASATAWEASPEREPPAEEAPDMSVAKRTVIAPPKFPLEVLGPWQDWVVQAAEAKSAAPDYLAASLITAAAASIGAIRWCQPQDGWREPSVIWMLVGPPSTNKSPSMDAVRDGLAPIEQEMFAAFDDASKKYEEEKAVAEAAEKIWEKDVEAALKDSRSAPECPKGAEAPEAPALERLTITDATFEAVAAVLSVNRRGVLLLRDELSAWAANLEKYGEGDRAFWIETYGGRSHTVDRRKLGAKPMLIEHLAVSVLGGIQPDRLESQILEGDDDGLAASSCSRGRTPSLRGGCEPDSIWHA